MAIPYKFLLRTAENGNCNELSRIIESGCNLNYQKKKSGKTALMLAVQRGKLEAVKLLTGAGADLNLRDKYGETALMMAALRGLASIARYLAEQGANVDIQDNFRQSALMRAAQRNDMAMAEILISAGANLNQQDQSGKTALIYAALRCFADMLHLLLKSGADGSLINSAGDDYICILLRNYPQTLTVIKESIENSYKNLLLAPGLSGPILHDIEI